MPGHVVDGSLNLVVMDQTLDPKINNSKKETSVFPMSTPLSTQNMELQKGESLGIFSSRSELVYNFLISGLRRETPPVTSPEARTASRSQPGT